MKIYVSGSFAAREQLKVEADYWRSLGHEVTSNWLYEPPINHADLERSEWEKRARANEDMLDVERSDAMIIYTDVPSTSGGRLVELGIAIAKRIPVYVVGPRENIFYYNAEVRDIEEFMRGQVIGFRTPTWAYEKDEYGYVDQGVVDMVQEVSP